MAAVMHASANNYSTRHSTGEYALRTSSTSTNSYFPWPEAHSSLTSPSATMSTHSHRSMMQHGDTTQGTHSTASTSTYNSNWSSIYTPTSSESAHSLLSSHGQTTSSHSSLSACGHGHSASSLRNALQPASISSITLSTDNILSAPREHVTTALDGPGQYNRRTSHPVPSNAAATGLSTTLTTASWDGSALISFNDADANGFDDDTYASTSTSPVTTSTTDRSTLVKAEPDETQCQFILESYADDPVASPTLTQATFDTPLPGASGSATRGGQSGGDSSSRRANTLPLRAVNACPEMFAMMGVIRLDPFASVNGVPQNKNIPSLWNGEPRPLDDEPVLLEWQVDLLEPLVPQTPESECVQLPDVESEDGYDAVKLRMAGPMRERMKSPLPIGRRGSVGSSSVSASSRGSMSPHLRLLPGSRADRSCRSPFSYPSRSSVQGHVGRRDSDETSSDFSFSMGGNSLMGGSVGVSAFSKGRLGTDHVMGSLLDDGVGPSGSLTGGLRDSSYLSSPPLHSQTFSGSNSVRSSQSHGRQRSYSHAMQPIPTSHSQNRTLPMYDSLYSAQQPQLAQPFTSSYSQAHSILPHPSSHAQTQGDSSYAYSALL